MLGIAMNFGHQLYAIKWKTTYKEEKQIPKHGDLIKPMQENIQKQTPSKRVKKIGN